MTRRPALALLLLAAGCAQPQPASRPHGDAAAAQACRQQADAVMERRDRAVLYREEAFPQGFGRDDPQRRTEELARSFERDRILRECLRGAPGTGS